MRRAGSLAKAKLEKRLPQPPPGYGCEVWIPELALKYWRTRDTASVTWQTEWSSLGAPRLDPFAEAAWQLCLKGVLRPGPGGDHVAQTGTSVGFGFTLTAFGVEWAMNAPNQAPTDPTRFGALLQQIPRNYGPAFLPRAVEAASCYRSANYLACCAMAGAAAEAILLTISAAKVGGQEEAIRIYHSSGGRNKTLNRVAGTLPKQLKSDITSLANLVSFWRDEAAHGISTVISEIQASMALTHLLNFAQIIHHNWRVIAEEDHASDS